MSTTILPHDNRLPETITPLFYPKPHKIIIEQWSNSLIVIGAKYVSSKHISTIFLGGGYTINKAVKSGLKGIEVQTKPKNP